MVTSEGRNLVFILSLPRSGSTLLSAMLGNHSKVLAPPEPWLLLRLSEYLGKGHDWPLYDDHLAGIGVRQLLKQENFIKAARAFALVAYNSLLRDGGAQVLVDKTPRYYHILEFLDSLFPRAKKIWLKRHPLDVAASYKLRWRRGIDVLLGDRPDGATVDFVKGLPALAEYFNGADGTKHELRYEDLVNDPRSEMERLAAFCGIEFEDAMAEIAPESRGVAALRGSAVGDAQIQQSETIRQSTMGQWESAFTQDEAQRLACFIGREMFDRMGYVVDESRLAFALTAEERTRLREHVKARVSLMQEARVAAIYEFESALRHRTAELARHRQERVREIGDLKRQLTYERERVATLELAQCQLEQTRQVDELKRQLSTERERTASLRQQLTTEWERAASLRQQLTTERERATKLTRQLSSERERAATLTQHLSSQRERVAALTCEVKAERDRATGAERTLAIQSSLTYCTGRTLLAPAVLLRRVLSRFKASGR